MRSMTAERGNKVYTINESMKDQYQADGFDIRDDDGKVIAYGKGKSVPYGDYAALKAENEQLRAQLAAAEKKAGPKKAGE